MRIYNNTNAQIEFELTPGNKIVTQAKQYSTDFLPSIKALDNLVVVFKPSEIAFLVRGAAELSMCNMTKSNTISNYVCVSFEEVSERFGLSSTAGKKEEPVTVKEEVRPEAVKEDVDGAVLKEKVIEAAPEEVVSEPVVDTPKTEPEPTKKSKKKKKD